MVYAEATAQAAVWAAFGAIGAALVSGGIAAWTNRKRNPNTLMDTFIREVGNDNDRLREENEQLHVAVANMQDEIRANQHKCEREIEEVRREARQKERDLEARITKLQDQIYLLQQGSA